MLALIHHSSAVGLQDFMNILFRFMKADVDHKIVIIIHMVGVLIFLNQTALIIMLISFIACKYYSFELTNLLVLKIVFAYWVELHERFCWRKTWFYCLNSSNKIFENCWVRGASRLCSVLRLWDYIQAASPSFRSKMWRVRPCPNLAHHLELRPSKDEGPICTFEKSLKGSNGLFACLKLSNKAESSCYINKFKKQATEKYEYFPFYKNR